MKPVLRCLGGPESGAAALLRHADKEVRTYSDWRTKHMLRDLFEIEIDPRSSAEWALPDRGGRVLVLADRHLGPSGIRITRSGLCRLASAADAAVCVDLAVLDPFYAPGSGANGAGGWSTRRLVAVLAGLLAESNRSVSCVSICGYVPSGDRHRIALSAATAVIQTVAEAWR